MPLYGGGGAGASVPAPAATHKWTLQEATGATAADTAGTDALTVVGAVTLQALTVPCAARPVSMRMLATGYLRSTAGAPADMRSAGVLLAVWYRPRTTPTGAPAIIHIGDGNGAVNTGMVLQQQSASTALTLVRYGFGSLGTFASAVPPNVWHRLAMWVPASGASTAPLVFVDGVLRITGTANTRTNAAADRLALGATWSSAAGGAASSIAEDADFSQARAYACAVAEEAQFTAMADYLGQIGVAP